jgi:hypothetical protein
MLVIIVIDTTAAIATILNSSSSWTSEPSSAAAIARVARHRVPSIAPLKRRMEGRSESIECGHECTVECAVCLEPVRALPWSASHAMAPAMAPVIAHTMARVRRRDGDDDGDDDGDASSACRARVAWCAMCARASRTCALEGADVPMAMPCGHAMHAQCLLRTLLETDNALCPTCRRDVVGAERVSTSKGGVVATTAVAAAAATSSGDGGAAGATTGHGEGASGGHSRAHGTYNLPASDLVSRYHDVMAAEAGRGSNDCSARSDSFALAMSCGVFCCLGCLAAVVNNT